MGCGAAATSANRIGKVFVVVGQDVRRFLIREQFFTRRTASEHANVLCTPRASAKRRANDADRVTSPLREELNSARFEVIHRACNLDAAGGFEIP